MKIPQKLMDYLKQSTTQVGLGLLAGSVVASATHVLSVSVASSIAALALPMLLPSNSTDRIKAQDVTNAALAAAAAGSGKVLVPVEQEAVDVFNDLVNKAKV